MVPACSVQVAASPLSDTIRRCILPGGQAASDTRRLLVYFRLDPDGRFLIGGRGVAMATAMSRVLAEKAMGVPDDKLDVCVSPLHPIPFVGFRR